MRDIAWPSGAYAFQFADEQSLINALAVLRDRGYANVTTYTPYPVAGVDEASSTRSFIPTFVFAAGAFGGIAGYVIQWYANAVSYPLNIGGRPAHATPAFFIPTFEGVVLAAALAAVAALFVTLRLPQPWHPMFEVDGFERASNDAFWLAVDAADPQITLQPSLPSLDDLHAIRAVRVPPA